MIITDMSSRETRRFNEMDMLFYSHSFVREGVYRFAGCFECALDDLELSDLEAAVARLVELYPDVLLADPQGDRRAFVEHRVFTDPDELIEFYRASLAEPVEFGNVLLRATIVDKPRAERALFLLIPHFAGDSKIAAFVLRLLLDPQEVEKAPRRLSVVTYRDLARRNIHGLSAWVKSLVRELVEMLQSFAFTSPAKGKVGVITVFLDDPELKTLNGLRREFGLSRSHLLQVAALRAYRAVVPHHLARVFNIIYDNSPSEPTVSNCFRSMPLVVRRPKDCMDFVSCRARFVELTRRYTHASDRYAFALRSILVSLLPLSLLRQVFLRSTRGVQHYISYVFLDGNLELPSRPGGHRIWANIEPVGYSLSNFNVVEMGKQISLNLTWDTASLSTEFGEKFMAELRGSFRPESDSFNAKERP